MTSEPTRGQTTALVLFGLALFGIGIYTLQSFMSALAWAAIFAVALWPFYLRVQHRFGAGKHNILLPMLFTLATMLLFVVPLALVGVQLVQEARDGLHWMHEAQQSGLPVPESVARVPLIGGPAAGWWHDNLSDAEGVHALFGRFGQGNLMVYSRQVGAQLAHRIVTFAFMLVTLFFLFRDGAGLVQGMQCVGRKVFGPRGEALGRQIIASIHGTVDGLVLVGLGQGVLIGIAYAIAGVPHPVLFGAITGVAAMIPFGAPVVFAVASLLLLADGQTGWAIGVFVWGFAVGFVADHFIRPVLIGGATKLPFLWVLLGILGGVEVFGLLGLFLGPAIMATLILLWRELSDPAPA